MIDNRTVGKTIAALRQAKGMTQQQLAAAMNVSHQAVSKWENGAALPDIQTLMELTRLFGITVEQLLSGEIPEARMETHSTLDEHLHSIGSFVSGVIDDIGQVFKPDNGVKQEEAPADNAAEKPQDDPQEESADFQHLLEMAPFMSKGAVEEMLRGMNRKLSAAEIAKFAPFVTPVFLERMIRDNEPDITWDSLRRIAPFLKKEAVDAFAKMIAAGGKITKTAPEDVSRAADDVKKTLDDVSQRLGKSVDKAVRKVVRISGNVAGEVSRALDNLAGEMATREERQARLRRSAFERAMQDGRWDWIEAHLAEISDDEFRRCIFDKADSLGMQEWVGRNMGGRPDFETVNSAVEKGDWEWLGGHIGELDAVMQQHAVKAALQAGNWQWLDECAELLDLGEHAAEIVSEVRCAGEKALAARLARLSMTADRMEQTVMDALNAKDFEFVDMLEDVLSGDQMGRCCVRMAKNGEWESVKRFSEKLRVRDVEWLMEIAIETGNFEAIDMLDAVLAKKENEET